jgi:carboxylesterase type B
VGKSAGNFFAYYRRFYFIFDFSGNPNQITVMGQQAGGASVHYHLLSPLARGLFNR